MEIMIAMFILAVVISLVFGSLDGVFGAADHVNAQSDLLETKPYHFTRIEIVVSNDDESTYNLRTYRFFVD
jgi:ABC-type cobalt transport system substrate-binding protein